MSSTVHILIFTQVKSVAGIIKYDETGRALVYSAPTILIALTPIFFAVWTGDLEKCPSYNHKL